MGFLFVFGGSFGPLLVVGRFSIGSNMSLAAAHVAAQEHAAEATFERQIEGDEKYAAQQLQKQSKQLKRLLALRDVAVRL